LQPSGLTGNRWPDGRALFDYGYRRIFTPDVRATNFSAGTTTAFGIDALNDGHAVSAKLVGTTGVVLCSWNTDATAGSLTAGACALHGVAGLAPGALPAPPPRLRATRISTLEADGDYFVGQLEGDHLRLHLWRVGQR
jgi:hypothetical protein